jgi:hypothetical protein
MGLSCRIKDRNGNLQMLSKAQDEYVKVGTHWEPHRVMMGMKFMVLSRDPVQILLEVIDTYLNILILSF